MAVQSKTVPIKTRNSPVATNNATVVDLDLVIETTERSERSQKGEVVDLCHRTEGYRSPGPDCFDPWMEDGEARDRTRDI